MTEIEKKSFCRQHNLFCNIKLLRHGFERIRMAVFVIPTAVNTSCDKTETRNEWMGVYIFFV